MILIHNIDTVDCLTNGQLGELIDTIKIKNGDVDKLVETSSDSPPWESVRLIGHRGSGKTARPVLQ